MTDLQPLRLLTNETADSYFDFDIEPESPGSPIDECEYSRLIETTASKAQPDVALESGFVCASPSSTLESGDSHASASSSDAQFFDPETSETENNHSLSGTEYYDCQEAGKLMQTKASHGDVTLKPYNLESSSMPSPNTVSSSSSSSSSKINGHKKKSDDSCDSLPSSQSTELTNSSSNLTLSKSSNSNSTLQDTDVDAASVDVLSVDALSAFSTDAIISELVNVDKTLAQNDNGEMEVEQKEEDEEEESNHTKYDIAKTKFIKYNEAEDEEEEEAEKEEEKEERVEEHVDEVTHNETGYKEKASETDGFGVVASLLEVSEYEYPIEIKTEMDDSSATEVITEISMGCSNNSQNAETEVIVTHFNDDTKENEEQKAQSTEEEEEDRPQRVRRCSSLKTGKTPPGTPGRKKIVRFADVLGLDLADVRTFLDEVPKVPKSAFEDLELATSSAQSIQLGPPLEKILVPMFQQPGALPGFLEKVRDKQVCMENAAVTDPVSLTITGTVRVRNLDFHKSVHIRYSLDNWRTYSDLSANYVENSCDGFSDKFSFMLFGNSLQIGQRLEMAIRFQAKGEQFWDNNYGVNYCFQCLPCTSQRPVVASNPVPPKIESTDAERSIRKNVGHQQWSNAFLY